VNYKIFLLFFCIDLISSASQLDELLKNLVDKRTYSIVDVKTRKIPPNNLWNKELFANNSGLYGRYSWAGDYSKNWFTKKTDSNLDYLAMLNPSLVKQIKAANKNLSDIKGQYDVVLNMPSVIDTGRWMTQLWHFIKKMPANQFIFPGTHDSLTGHDKVYDWRNLTTDKSKVQENLTFKQQLESGVRLFDIRFVNCPSWHCGTEKIANMVAVHSGAIFQFYVDAPDDQKSLSFIKNLKEFLRDGKKDILIIGLSLAKSSSVLGSTKFSPDNRWDEFIDLLKANSLDDKIIKTDNLDPSSTLEHLSSKGNIIIQTNNTNYNGKYKNYFWGPSEGPGNPNKSWGNERTPQQWFKELMKKDGLDYENYPLSSDKVFSYLPMTQGGADGEATWLMNGVLGDWLLFANEDTPENERPRDFINNTDKKFVLPYPKYRDASGQIRSMQNFNLVNVDYVDRSPFVLNCIAQNLKVSKKFA
jgi:hypothetical protein